MIETHFIVFIPKWLDPKSFLALGQKYDTVLGAFTYKWVWTLVYGQN